MGYAENTLFKFSRFTEDNVKLIPINSKGRSIGKPIKIPYTADKSITEDQNILAFEKSEAFNKKLRDPSAPRVRNRIGKTYLAEADTYISFFQNKKENKLCV